MHDHPTPTSAPARAHVLIVGIGPVGLTLAVDLATRGLSAVVVETRNAGEPPSVKRDHVSARSMEVFRRLGPARKPRCRPARRIIRTMWKGRSAIAN